MHWVVTAVAVLLAAAAGLYVGYTRWGTPATSGERVERRLESTESEAATLRAEKVQIEQRLEQVTKEQERLAQENEILRKQQATERILDGPSNAGNPGNPGGPLPDLPPK